MGARALHDVRRWWRVRAHRAMDGVEALAWLEEQPTLPDLILLDCMMPHMSGHEFCAALRQVGAGRWGGAGTAGGEIHAHASAHAWARGPPRHEHAHTPLTHDLCPPYTVRRPPYAAGDPLNRAARHAS